MSNNEVFTCTYSAVAGGAQLTYNGKGHAFTLGIPGSHVKRGEAKGGAANQVFLAVDNITVLVAIVPLPPPIPEDYKLSALTPDQQKQTLQGYEGYEMDYFTNELHVKIPDLKEEWLRVGPRLYYIWEFSKPVLSNGGKNTAVPGQIYVSTTCFNQVLTVSSPLFNNSDRAAQLALLKKIALSLKLYNNRLPVKK